MALYEVGRLRRNEMELKTHLVRFNFGFTYQISVKSKNKRFQSMVDLEPIQSASTVL